MSRHESPEVGAMVRRMVRALVRRSGEGDQEALEELHKLEAIMPTAMTVAGYLAWRGEWDSAREGYSFTELGRVVGTTRQSARVRFGQGTLDRLDPDLVAWLCEPRAGSRVSMEGPRPGAHA